MPRSRLFAASSHRPAPLRMRSALTAAAVCAGLALPTPASAATVSPAAQFIADVNAARSAHGLHTLKASPDLSAVAAKWAAAMAKQHGISHNPKLGSAVHNWRVLAENVGMGQNVPQLHNAFMNSPHHRANILDVTYTQVGVGVVVVSGEVYVVEDFRRPS